MSIEDIVVVSRNQDRCPKKGLYDTILCPLWLLLEILNWFSRLQWHGLPSHAQKEKVRQVGWEKRRPWLGRPERDRETNASTQESRKGKYTQL